MDWRHSLALLGGFSFMAIALGTWRNGGRYGSVLLALLTPDPFVCIVGWTSGRTGIDRIADGLHPAGTDKTTDHLSGHFCEAEPLFFGWALYWV